MVKPSQSKGKSYAEWDVQRKGTSWKAKLKAAIDAIIPQDKDFDDFLRLIQAQGYGIPGAKALKGQGVKKLPNLYALKAEYKRLA